MNNLIKLFAFIACISFLQGCVGTYNYNSEYVVTCKAVAGSEWSGGGVDLTLKRGNASYSFSLNDQGSNNTRRFGKTDMFLVRVYGATAGNAVGWFAPEMVYNPKNAFIETNGKKIYALPKVWEADLVNGYYAPTKELSIPTNLNVIRPVPQYFFIGFKFDPSARDVYRIHPGAIMLDGVKTDLPAFSSCYAEGEGHWTPLH